MDLGLDVLNRVVGLGNDGLASESMHEDCSISWMLASTFSTVLFVRRNTLHLVDLGRDVLIRVVGLDPGNDGLASQSTHADWHTTQTSAEWNPSMCRRRQRCSYRRVA